MKEDAPESTLGMREDLKKILFAMMKGERSGEVSEEVRTGADSVRRVMNRIDYLEDQLDETDGSYRQLRRFCLEDREKISQLNASARKSEKKYSDELSLLEEQLEEMREECEEELKEAREDESKRQRELRDFREQGKEMRRQIDNLRWAAGLAGFFAIILLMVLAGH